MPLILNTAQAEAVYSAMCALNNVGGRLDSVVLPGTSDSTYVGEGGRGKVAVERAGDPPEVYANQNAFAAAYGLSTGA